MKLKILNLSTSVLFFAFINSGCQKDDVNLSTSGIVGEWQSIKFPETCVGFGNVQLEITSDSVFKQYVDDELTLVSTFNIKAGAMGYDTIFFHNPDVDFSYNFISFLGNDTLLLDLPIYYVTQPCNCFKRKK
jgi:hypothetical protein